MSEQGSEQGNKRKRLKNWSVLETTFFIQFCKEHKVLEKIDGKKFRWNDVLAPVSTDMAECEYHFERDTTQLLNKLKNLQKQFREAVTHNSKSGNEPSKFFFYEDMNELCGSRPRNVFPIACGVERDYDLESEANANVSLNDSDDDGAGPSAPRDEEDGNETVEDDTATPTRTITESRKRKKPNRSYGAALLDFSEDFITRFKEANNEFLDGMKELQDQQQQFDKEAMEEDRNFIRQLFQNM